MEQIVQQVQDAFFPEAQILEYRTIGIGHINDTYRLVTTQGEYLFQRINHLVFQQPQQVVENYRLVYEHLSQQKFPLLLSAPIPTRDQQLVWQDSKGNSWRMLIFLKGTHSLTQTDNVKQVEAASRAVALFLKALNTNSPAGIAPTIPNFHRFQYRYEAYLAILEKNTRQRAQKAQEAIQYLAAHKDTLPNLQALNIDNRLVHNDPKMSNLLLNDQEDVVAVIDWDTIMPGAFATDFGDMVRTMVVSADENETNLEKVQLIWPYLEAICQHFLPPLAPLFNEQEKATLHLGPAYILLEQMLRFLSDYLDGDQYYKVHYAEQNLDRAMNQMKVHQLLSKEEKRVQDLISTSIN
ncbi:MAG: aminoglycoside phosphotransferase family protein [Bacteroidota bacterium]